MHISPRITWCDKAFWKSYDAAKLTKKTTTKRHQYELQLWKLNSWGLRLPNTEWQQLFSFEESGLSWSHVSLVTHTRILKICAWQWCSPMMITHYKVFMEILKQWWNVSLVKEISAQYLLSFTGITARCLDSFVVFIQPESLWNQQNVFNCEHMLCVQRVREEW